MRASTTRALCLAATTGVGGFVGLTALQHRLRPDIDPVRYAISQYTIGPYGWTMHVAFVCLALGVASLALATLARTSTSVSRHTAPALGLAGVGALVVVLFETDPIDTRTSTPVSYVHEVGVAIGLLGVVLAQLSVALRRRTPPPSRVVALSRVLLVLSLAVPVALLPLGVGAAERALVLTGMTWLVAWAAALWPARPSA